MSLRPRSINLPWGTVFLSLPTPRAVAGYQGVGTAAIARTVGKVRRPKARYDPYRASASTTPSRTPPGR